MVSQEDINAIIASTYGDNDPDSWGDLVYTASKVDGVEVRDAVRSLVQVMSEELNFDGSWKRGEMLSGEAITNAEKSVITAACDTDYRRRGTLV